MKPSPRSRPAHGLAAVPLLLATLAATGCRSPRTVDPWGGRTLAAGLSKDELVAHVNGQAQNLSGWRCRNVRVSVPGMPTAGGRLAVTYPRNLRLQVSAMTVAVADIGSNADRMWFWVKDPAVGRRSETVTCRHASFDAVRAAHDVPFDPDWLMEVLGVAPIDPRCVELRKAPDGGPLWHLVSHRTDPGGRRVTRVIHVDAAHGQVIAHELRDAATQSVIAKALLQDHRRDARTGMVLPHRIELDWPAAGTGTMVLALGDIEVNPQDLHAGLWELPRQRAVRELDGCRPAAATAAVPAW